MKKPLNYSNYTLGGHNIIRNTNLHQDKNYNDYITNHLIDYRKDYNREARTQLDKY